MPEQSQLRSALKGNKCNVTDVMKRVNLARPPVNLGMYRTLYMIDYKPFSEILDDPATLTIDPIEQSKLDAQLKAKEFARPIEPEPMKYAEEPICQEVHPPYPNTLDRRYPKASEVPSPVQQVQRRPLKYFNPVIPIPTPHVEPTVPQEEEKKPTQQTDVCAVPDNADAPIIKQDPGQNWDSYEQFILEKRRAITAQIKEIKKLHLGSSVFQDERDTPTDASTYQRDYKYWPRSRSGFCRAHRNYSSLVFEDDYNQKNPWMSEYMDNYNIFLKKLNWISRKPGPSLCSTKKPTPYLSQGVSTQTPIAVNAAH